jgi:Lrp/AsnC family transcriptional regulator for asnA, asnC and gidA
MPFQAKVDDIDVSLVRALQKDARANFSDIAKDCGVSTDTISKRFKRLKRTGIVKGTTILLNPRSLGNDCVANFGICVDYPHVEEVVNFVKSIPEVVFCTSSMGRYNIFAITVLKNVDKIGQVKERIKGYPKVREVAANIWIDDILLCPENFEFEHLKK